MRWIPYEVFEIECPGDPGEVLPRLEPVVAESRFLSFGRPDRPFAGAVHRDGFDVQRVGHSGALFAIELHGRIRPSGDKQQLVIEAVPAVGTLAIVAGLVLGVVLLIFRSGPRVPLFCAGAVAVAWLICMAGFWIDAGRSRRLLASTLTDRK